MREDAIGNMLVKFPPLLTYSLHKKIRPVVCSFSFDLLTNSILIDYIFIFDDCLKVQCN